MIERAFLNVYTKFKLHFYNRICSRGDGEGLTTMESFCMEGIMAMPNPTIAEFARMMGISTPNAATKVKSLLKKGYVQKVQSTTDRREYHLIPSEKYVRSYGVSYAYLQTVQQRVEKRFSPEDCAKLTEMLNIISAELMPEIQLSEDDSLRKLQEL